MDNMMTYMRPLGFFAIFIAAFTWGMELAHFVPPCPYCQVQRTMIGFLGILMILPDYRYISLWLGVGFALLGIHVSSAQMFINYRDQTFANLFFILGTCALFIMVAQGLMLATRAYQRYR